MRKQIIQFICCFMPQKKLRKDLRYYLTNLLDKESCFKYKNVRYTNAHIAHDVKIGEFSYLDGGAILPSGTEIGRYCSIARNFSVFLGRHNYHTLTTSYLNPCFFKGGAVIVNSSKAGSDHKKVIIGNDVWIGADVKIVNSITIGNGAVIGAGSIVTKDIPDYAIAVGVPAEVIKYRFDPSIIKRLQQTKWWDLDINDVMNLPTEDIEKCLEVLENGIY